MNWHKHMQRKLNTIIMIKKNWEKSAKETVLKKEWKGTGVVYIQ